MNDKLQREHLQQINYKLACICDAERTLNLELKALAKQKEDLLVLRNKLGEK